jgi:hypothetical protein
MEAQPVVQKRKQPNQWTKKRQDRNLADLQENWQKNPRFSVGRLLSMLVDNADGKIELTPSKVRAIEVVLDRMAPKLSAVEQTVVEAAATRTEAELLQAVRDNLRQAIDLYPDLVQEALAEHARSVSSSSPNPTQDTLKTA